MLKLQKVIITTAAALFSLTTMAATTQTTTATTSNNQNISSNMNTSGDTGTSSNFSQQQVKDIQKIIHNYMISNPEILVEASQALQKKQAEAADKAAQSAIVQNKSDLFNNPNSPSIGNPTGKAVVVEFFDYQCGHCKAMNQVIQNLVKQNQDVKVIFKELPIFGGDSRYAAKAALAAAKQGKYYPFHDALLAEGNPLTKKKIMKIAKKVGLNLKTLRQDMNSEAINNQIRDNFQLAQKLKLMGTPAFIIGNNSMTNFKFIPGATTQDNLQDQINAVIGASDNS